MGVLDFGSDEEIKAASKEIIIQWLINKSNHL
jgi:hypothetical protein